MDEIMLCAIEKAVSNSIEKPGLIFSTATSRIIMDSSVFGHLFLMSQFYPKLPNLPS